MHPENCTRNDLDEALNDLLGGVRVRIPLTNPIGCTVKWKGHDSHWMPKDVVRFGIYAQRKEVIRYFYGCLSLQLGYFGIRSATFFDHSSSFCIESSLDKESNSSERIAESVISKAAAMA